MLSRSLLLCGSIFCQSRNSKAVFRWPPVSRLCIQGVVPQAGVFGSVLAFAARRTSTAVVNNKSQKIVGKWLLGCAGMCFGAVVLGGITRLTESGLSITQWNLIHGMKPPRTEQEWMDEFNKYKQYPEYKYLERELSVDEFKMIFYWEYVHRMWGRSIGLMFAIPAMIFLRKGWISKTLKPRLAVYAALLGFQGALGWFMVKSGLEDKADPYAMPRVSQYRLAAHLGSAFILYSLFLWQGLSHVLSSHQLSNVRQVIRLGQCAHLVVGLVFITALSGAFVAGLDAGLVYNTWPKMADKWIPTDLTSLNPKWRNAFENATTVQFIHRRFAELTGVSILTLWWLCRRSAAVLPRRTLLVANSLAAMALLQIGLGISTLLMYVPVWLASSHQAGALSLLTFSIWLAHELRRMPK